MKCRQMGSLNVSEVGLGCNNFGRRLDAESATKVIEAAIDAGITLFDTADTYGDSLSEVILGKALRPFHTSALLRRNLEWGMASLSIQRECCFGNCSTEGSLRRLRD